MQRPIDVGVLRLSTVIELDEILDSCRDSLTFQYRNYRMQHAVLNFDWGPLRYEFSYSIWVVSIFFTHMPVWMFPRIFVLVYLLVVYNPAIKTLHCLLFRVTPSCPWFNAFQLDHHHRDINDVTEIYHSPQWQKQDDRSTQGINRKDMGFFPRGYWTKWIFHYM